MGDLRATYRYLVPALVDAGYRVATMDLRGHGDSDATFSCYDDEAVADDALALAAELSPNATVTLVGNSMGAAAAVIAAARRPEAIANLILIGPFVRNPPTSRLMLLVFRVLMAPLWNRWVWAAYLPTLYAGTRPADFDSYRRLVSAALARPGHARAFARTTQTSHDSAETALDAVAAQTLIVMGSQDPDFADPGAEAIWIARRLNGHPLVVPNAGHYPQSQRPDLVNPAIVAFLHDREQGAEHA